VHARIYTAPDATAIQDGTLVVRNGWIASVGPGSGIAVPDNIRTIDCRGLTAMAGFWNSHVHFTEAKWRNAKSAATAQLEAQLADMLLSRGFTAVFDTGSETLNTIALRERVRTGEVLGPLILTTGTPLAPENGTPYYLKTEPLPEVRTPEEALQRVRELVNQGVDGIKLFSGSWVTREKTVTMPSDVVAAAVAEAHRVGLPVFAHPSDAAGLRSAVEGGVDILAHAEEVPGTIDAALMARMNNQGMALIPTLKLFSRDATLPNILKQVKSYADSGGDILFGTDVGYLTDYDPSQEFDLLAKAGLSFRQILASLTTTPAKRFGYAGRKGRLSTEMDGDIVVVGGNPEESIASLSDVRFSVRQGQLFYARVPR